ncbi:MAG: hypothetical protein LBM75_09700 [Myxococcales bacterium]|nr:hypothetical protein [Myxococcales bacterium]
MNDAQPRARWTARAARLLLALCLLATPATVVAQSLAIPTLREVSSVRSLGMGDATRAFASSDEALWVNPAGMAATTRFNLNASATFDPPNGLQLYSIGSIDSKLNADKAFPMAGGLSYTYYRSGKGEAKRSGSIVLLGLALPLWHQDLTIGVTSKYLRLDGGGAKSNAVTMDAGIVFRPMPILSLGAVGYNLIDIDSPEARRAWGFGAAVGHDKGFRLAFDIKLETASQEDDGWKPSFFAGGEILLGGRFMPRAGYTYDALRKTHKVCGGLSVFLGILAIEGAYQYAFDDGHVFGFTLRLLDTGGSSS